MVQRPVSQGPLTCGDQAIAVLDLGDLTLFSELRKLLASRSFLLVCYRRYPIESGDNDGILAENEGVAWTAA
jgi:hypothetical protein